MNTLVGEADPWLVYSSFLDIGKETFGSLTHPSLSFTILITHHARISFAVHIIRDVVNWYQGFERSQHKGQGMQLPKTTDPIEMLLDSSVIPKLVEEGKADTIIDTLRSYNQLSCVDKEALVRIFLCVCVSLLRRKSISLPAHGMLLTFINFASTILL